MRLTVIAATIASVGLFTGAAVQAKDHGGLGETAQKALEQAVAGPQRTEANRARDQYRHPVETLTFIGVKPKDTVVELWPGGGWYTEILAPYLAERGKLIAAAPAGKGAESMAKRFDANPALYGKVARANFPTVLGGTGVAPGTADVVLTFRNRSSFDIAYEVEHDGTTFNRFFALNVNNGAQVNVTASGLLSLPGNLEVGNGTSGTLSANEYLDVNWNYNYWIAGPNSGATSYANTMMTSTTSSGLRMPTRYEVPRPSM